MIYPIKDESGRPKDLYEIEYSDLSQLVGFDEGYYAEYKEILDSKVVSKVVCSFANSSGGWLFIGVDNDGKLCDIPKGRTDLSQTIGESVSDRVSPLPILDCKFVENPDNKDFGVLVVRVQEGYESPYISSGTVFVRTGSSSKKTGGFFEGARDSSVLRSLEEKRRVAEGKRLDFYRRDIFYPLYKRPGGHLESSFPMLSIYLYRLVKGDDWIEDQLLDEARANIDEIMHTSLDWRKYVLQETPGSLVVRQGIMNNVDNVSCMIELFRTGSMKVHAPLYLLQSEERDLAIARLSECTPLRNGHMLEVVDGNKTLTTILGCTKLIDGLLESNPLCGDKRDYLIGIEAESCDGVAIFSSNDSYDDYVRKMGIPCFAGSCLQSLDISFRGYLEMVEEISITNIVSDFIVEAMGFPKLTRDMESRNNGIHILTGVDLDQSEDNEEG